MLISYSNDDVTILKRLTQILVCKLWENIRGRKVKKALLVSWQQILVSEGLETVNEREHGDILQTTIYYKNSY